MNELKGRSVTVAGAGVLGLACAVRLADAGARVVLCDPAGLADNASGVAAGMLAPAFESVLDPSTGARLDLLLAARDRWPALLERIGAPASALDRSGAVLVGRDADGPEIDALHQRLVWLGLSGQRLEAAELRALQPGLAPDLALGLHTPDDWRLDPASVLAGLSRAFRAAGGRVVKGALSRGREGWRLGGAAIPAAELVVLAAGAEAAALSAWAPELAVLQPVKGQILHFGIGPRTGAALRYGHSYIAPQPGGAVAGATMEVGLRDRELDPAVLADLRARAARLIPALASAPAKAFAGVRAATPDGLPLVGYASGDRRLILAVGARRNGWLLAPLVADTVAAIAAGLDAPFIEAFAPGRFAT